VSLSEFEGGFARIKSTLDVELRRAGIGATTERIHFGTHPESGVLRITIGGSTSELKFASSEIEDSAKTIDPSALARINAFVARLQRREQ
jgi:hypothetical protein